MLTVTVEVSHLDRAIRCAATAIVLDNEITDVRKIEGPYESDREGAGPPGSQARSTVVRLRKADVPP